MSNLRDIKLQIDSTLAIRDVTEALGDIATAKLKETKALMQHNVGYFQQLSIVYRTVKSLAATARHAKVLPQRKTNGRTVCILLTSNSHLYGGLDVDLTNFFYKNTLKLNTDVVVAGSFGAKILETLSYPKTFDRNFFKEDSPNEAELQALANKVFNHERILVFYSKFRTLLNQEPFISDISSSYLETDQFKSPYHYITEPDIDKILQFFDSQISYLLFKAIFLEVDLSRLAARMISMNQAQSNADKILAKQKKELLHFKKQDINIEIIENFVAKMSQERILENG